MKIIDTLTIALPKGKLGKEAVALLQEAGFPTAGLETEARRLLYTYEAEAVKYIICRPTDIPTYVEYGAAELGIAGKDVVVESEAQVLELLDLGFGQCRFVVAVPQEKLAATSGTFNLAALDHHRVATKFPRVAGAFFEEKGMQVEIIKLHGNIELAPQVGLADMVVDIVSTGRTLAENNLVAVADIFSATARLIVNRGAYRLKSRRVQEAMRSLEKAVKERCRRS